MSFFCVFIVAHIIFKFVCGKAIYLLRYLLRYFVVDQSWLINKRYAIYIYFCKLILHGMLENM